MINEQNEVVLSAKGLAVLYDAAARSTVKSRNPELQAILSSLSEDYRASAEIAKHDDMRRRVGDDEGSYLLGCLCHCTGKDFRDADSCGRISDLLTAAYGLYAEVYPAGGYAGNFDSKLPTLEYRALNGDMVRRAVHV